MAATPPTRRVDYDLSFNCQEFDRSMNKEKRPWIYISLLIAAIGLIFATAGMGGGASLLYTQLSKISILSLTQLSKISILGLTFASETIGGAALVIGGISLFFFKKCFKEKTDFEKWAASFVDEQDLTI